MWQPAGRENNFFGGLFLAGTDRNCVSYTVMEIMEKG